MKKAPAAGRLYDEEEEPTYESRGGGWYEKEKQTFPSPTPVGVSSSSSSFFFPFLRGREARQKSGSFSSFLPQRSLAQERPPSSPLLLLLPLWQILKSLAVTKGRWGKGGRGRRASIWVGGKGESDD